MSNNWRSALVIAGVLSLLLSACEGAADRTEVGSSTLSGQLRVVGGPAQVTSSALPGSVIATNTDTHEQHSVSVGSDGGYSLHLPPANYTIAGRSPSHGDDASRCAAQRRCGGPGGGVTGGVRVRQDWMKASRSALIVAAWVVGMPCGKPG